MSALLEQRPQIDEKSLSLDFVMEEQDDRWVVIVRYFSGSDLVRTKTHSFRNQSQAVLYKIQLASDTVH